eukprot:GILJ01011432.1.p2 GENE.GILJ01011432.1~~GILJ01011432.1.p2  ORF type:complete len:345 (-),score=32.17 GILJ01011432.1:77-1111(-)
MFAVALLVAQNVANSLAIQASRTGHHERYLPSSCVVIAELLKLCFSCAMCLKQWSAKGLIIRIKAMTLRHHIYIAVPALSYAIQNNLMYFSLSHLDVSTFQVLNQTKFVASALFAALMLQRKPSSLQWIAVVLITCSVSLVEVSNMKQQKTSETQSPAIHQLAALATLLASALSGFASVFVEKMLKHNFESLHFFNFLLGSHSIWTAGATMVVLDREHITQKGILQGYDELTWFIVINQAFGGIVVSHILKYLSNLTKLFACAIAILMSTICSSILFKTVITAHFCLAATITVCSLLVYIHPSAQPSVDKLHETVLVQSPSRHRVILQAASSQNVKDRAEHEDA